MDLRKTHVDLRKVHGRFTKYPQSINEIIQFLPKYAQVIQKVLGRWFSVLGAALVGILYYWLHCTRVQACNKSFCQADQLWTQPHTIGRVQSMGVQDKRLRSTVFALVIC